MMGTGSRVAGFLSSWVALASRYLGTKELRNLGTVLVLLVLTACRTAGPGSSITPLSAPTADAALAQLRARRESFTGARSLMRVRAISGEKRQSFTARLSVARSGHVEVRVFSPVGTTVATFVADGDRFRVDGAELQGQAAEVARIFSALKPYELALLLLGIPPRDDLAVEATPTGLHRATAGEVMVTFEPPVFPPRGVTVTRGADTLEITHQEIVAD